MKSAYKVGVLIVVGLLVSGTLVIDGLLTMDINGQVSALKTQINDLELKEIPINQTAYEQVAHSGWTKWYNNTDDLTAMGLVNNATLFAQFSAIQDQIITIRNQISAVEANGQSQGNVLVWAGGIGFLVVGLSVLVGYAIHRHIVTLIRESQRGLKS